MDHTLSKLIENITGVISKGIANLGDLHPLVVHFPIALLFIAPLFILIGLFFRKSSKTFYISALILMIVGILTLLLSLKTGDAAAEILEADPTYAFTLDSHYNLAERSRTGFIILTGLFLLYVIFHSLISKKLNRILNVLIVCIFLFFYVHNLLILLNTAHYGGKLVHQHGIYSNIYSESE